MATVFDTSTNKVVNVDDTVASANPTQFQPLGDQNVYMQDQTGKNYNVPAKSVPQAVEQGWTHAPDDQIAKFKEEDAAYEENKGAFTQGLQSAENQFGFGVPEIVTEHSHSPEYLKGLHRAQEEHPIARTIGGAVGLVGNIAATEGTGLVERAGEAVASHILGTGAEELGSKVLPKVGETVAEAASHAPVEGAASAVSSTEQALTQGVEAGANKAMATGQTQGAIASAIKSATTGAIYAAPSAAAQLGYGDKEAAAENLLIGTGIGGIVGLGAGLFTKGLDAGQDLIKSKAIEHGYLTPEGKINPEKFQKLSDESELQQLGITKKDANQLGDVKVANMAKTMREENLQGATRDTLLEKQKQLGQAISDHSDYLDNNLPSAVKTEPTLMGTEQKPVRDYGITPVDLSKQIEKTVLEQRPALNTPLLADDKKVLDTIVKTVASYGDDKSFKTLQEIKSLIGSEYENTLGKSPDALTPRDTLVRQTYNIIKSAQENEINKAYGALGMSERSTQYLADKAKYQGISNLLEKGPEEYNSFGNPLTNKVVPPGLRNTWLTNAAHGASAGISGLLAHGLGLGGLGYFAVRPVVDMVLKHTLLEKGLSLSNGVLRKLANNPETMDWVGAALTKNLWDKSIQKVASFPAILAGSAARHVPTDPVSQLLGTEGTTGRTKDQQFATISDALNKVGADPTEAKRQIDAISSLFGYDPELQKLFQQKQTNTIKYLADHLPHPPPPVPFSKNQPTISAQQKRDFLDRLEIVHNPDNIITHMQDGTVTNPMIDTMKEIYPKRYQQYLGQCLMMAYDPKFASLPNKTITAFAKYAESPQLDPNIKTIIMDQAKYQQAGQAPPPPNRGKANGSKEAKGFGNSALGGLSTNVQRLQYK